MKIPKRPINLPQHRTYPDQSHQRVDTSGNHPTSKLVHRKSPLDKKSSIFDRLGPANSNEENTTVFDRLGPSMKQNARKLPLKRRLDDETEVDEANGEEKETSKSKKARKRARLD